MEPRGYGFNPQQLIRLRKKSQLSQQQLAEACGLARMGIVRYEQGGAEPRIDSVQALSRVLEVEPQVFYDWSAELPQPTRPAAPPEQAEQMARNLSLLALVELGPLIHTLESLTSSDNPLDYDRDLHLHPLEELVPQVADSLKQVRQEMSLSHFDISQQTCIPSGRLAEIERGRGLPIVARELLALRQALGTSFDPRPAQQRNPQPAREKRGPRTLLQDSLREWKQRCQRTPNRLELLLERLSDQQKQIEQLQEKLASCRCTQCSK